MIKLLKSTNRNYGYNIKAGGNGGNIMFNKQILNDDEELFWYESYALPCLKYTKNGILIKRYNTIYEAANENKLGVYDIALCCAGKHISHKRYIWLFEKDSGTLKLKINSLKNNNKKVFRYEVNGKYIDCFNSLTEASIILNLHDGEISRVCNGKAYHCGGYIFSYINDEKIIQKKVDNLLNNFKHLFCPISQWDSNGNLVALHKNINEFNNIIGFNTTHISNVCNGKEKSHLGFIWRYEMYLFNNDRLLKDYEQDYLYVIENTETPQYIQDLIEKSKEVTEPKIYKYKHKYKSKQPKRRKSVICLTTGKIYESITIASEDTNAVKISECCNKKRKNSGKLENGTPLEWMYYKDYLKLKDVS